MALVTPLLWLLANVPSGISAGPVSWVRWSPDYHRILVMRTASPVGDEAYFLSIGKWKFLKIRDVFPASGVFELGNPNPLWTVTWFSGNGDLVSSDDLMMCARRNRFAVNSKSPAWAVELYHGDSLVRSYEISEFVTGPRLFLPYTTWDWHTQWYWQFEVIAGDRLLVETAPRFIPFYGDLRNPGDRYEISLSDGKVLNQAHPFLRQLQMVTAGMVFVFIVVPTVLMIWWLRRRRSA
jgi:hypothetical protein